MNYSTMLRLKNQIRAQRGAGPLIIVLVVLALVVGLVAYLYSSGSLNLAFGNNKRAETFAGALKTYGGHMETAVANLTSKGYDLADIKSAYTAGGLASNDSDVKLDARALDKAMFDKTRLAAGPSGLTKQNFMLRMKRTSATPSVAAPNRMQYLAAVPFISGDLCRALPAAEIGGQTAGTFGLSGSWSAMLASGDFETAPAAFIDATAVVSQAPNKSGCVTLTSGEKVFLHVVADVDSL